MAVEVRVQGYPCVGDGLVVCWGCWGEKSKAQDRRKGPVNYSGLINCSVLYLPCKILSNFAFKNLEHTIQLHTEDQDILEFCVLYRFQKARQYICYKEIAKFKAIYCAAVLHTS